MAKNYPGNKNIDGVYHKIINHIPVHKHYYELFAGEAAIAKLLPDTAEKYLVDPSDSVIKNLTAYFGDSVKIIKGQASDLVQSKLTSSGTDTFVFMDPPYHHDTRPNNKQLYEHEMEHADHVKLLLSVLQLKCCVMIIHPKCELYDTMLKDWCVVTLKIRYNVKTSIECLYMNYPAHQITLHTEKYLGVDCWDRQRIKRKANRFVSKLTVLPEQERKYIMNQLNQNFNHDNG